MNIFKLKHRVGWGNEIHIETKKNIYAGSGRGYSRNGGQIDYLVPNVFEFLDDVQCNGHCSTPYIKNGDHLIYTFDDGYEYVMIFSNVKYCRDPHDLFFGDLILSHQIGTKPIGFFRKKWNKLSSKPKIQVINGINSNTPTTNLDKMVLINW